MTMGRIRAGGIMWLIGMMSPLATGDTPASAPAALPQVRVFTVDETRARDLVNSHETATLGLELGIQVKYTPEIQHPVAYGDWHIARAIDDRGTDLRPPAAPAPSTEPFTAERFQKALEDARDGIGPNESYTKLFAALLTSQQKNGTDNFEIKMRLGMPPRSATKIARVKGDFTVFTGQPLKAKFDRPRRFYGHPLEDPALKSAGISVELLPADYQQPDAIDFDGPHVYFRCKGDLRALGDSGIEILDADGNSVTGGFGIEANPVKTADTVTLGLKKPLDDTMSIVINLIGDRGRVVVPFSVADISLP